jgi:hypothetical protein
MTCQESIVVLSPDWTCAAVAAALAHDRPETTGDGGGWPMSGDALALLTALVAELECAHVLEFGSGTSTVALARAVGELAEPGAVTAVENDPAARASTRAALRAAGAAERAVVQLAPLVARRVDGRHLPVYRLDAARFAHTAAPGLIVIDGPPSMLGGREGSIRQALGLADVGTLVLLDDADRPGEIATLAAVERAYGSALQRIPTPGFARGLAALVVTAAIPVRIGPVDVAPPAPVKTPYPQEVVR